MTFPLQSVNLNLLVYFRALIEERHVSHAAKKVGVTQPAMSVALKSLRKLFSDPLLVPGEKGLVPTPVALKLAEQIRPILKELGSILACPLVFDPKCDAIIFKVIMSDYSSAVLLPEIMRRMPVGCSGITFEILPWSTLNDPSQIDQVDLILGFYMDQTPEHFHEAVLFDDRCVVLVSAHHPRIKNRLTTKMYLKERHVAVRVEDGANGSVNQGLADLGVMRNIVLKVPYYLSMPIAVSQTDLIATTTSRTADIFAAHFPLRVFKAPFPLKAMPVKCLWHRRTDASPAHQWLRGLVMEAFEELTSTAIQD